MDIYTTSLETERLALGKTDIYTTSLETERVPLGNLYVERIKKRLHNRNQNWLSVICGGTGTGKSYSALYLANMIDPQFSIEQCCWKATKFMELINGERLKTGNMIIFDEAGVGMASREWYSIQNKLLGAILQSFRYRNLGVIFTVPNLSFIDIQARKLFHTYMETQYIDYYNEIAVISVLDLQHNSLYDHTYHKYPKFWVNEKLITVKKFYIPMPHLKLIEEYETNRKKHMQEQNDIIINELKKGEPGEKKGYPKHCNACGYDWHARRIDCYKCPRCQAILNWKPH